MDILTHITRSFEKAMGSDTSKPPEFSVLQRQMILSDIGFIDVIIKCLQLLQNSHENIEQQHGQLRTTSKSYLINFMNCCDLPARIIRT